MPATILVAYATQTGATKEVAEAIAATLREQGLAVDLQLARDVKSLAGYGAVVLGAPLYMARWDKDALNFLSRHKNALPALPVAIFAGGPFGTADEKVWQEVRQQLDRQLAKFAWLTPIAIEMVGGRFDHARLRFPWNLVPGLKQVPASDLRDWTAIRAWAIKLAAQLSPALSA